MNSRMAGIIIILEVAPTNWGAFTVLVSPGAKLFVWGTAVEHESRKLLKGASMCISITWKTCASHLVVFILFIWENYLGIV